MACYPMSARVLFLWSKSLMAPAYRPELYRSVTDIEPNNMWIVSADICVCYQPPILWVSGQKWKLFKSRGKNVGVGGITESIFLFPNLPQYFFYLLFNIILNKEKIKIFNY